MKTCFLFGHADAPDSIMPRLDEAIEKCYENGIVSFYVGNRGRFDSLAALAVTRAKLRHPDIRMLLVLAYHPAERPVDLWGGFDGSYYPPLEGTPRQYTIVKANRYIHDGEIRLLGFRVSQLYFPLGICPFVPLAIGMTCSPV